MRRLAQTDRTYARDRARYRAAVPWSLALPLLLAACAAPVRPQRPTADDNAAVRVRTRALFAAYDHDDAGAFTRLAADGFVLFDHLREFPGAHLADRLRSRHARGEPPSTRACESESITRGPGFAVYTAECSEFSAGAEERIGWNTVVWIRGDQGWRAAHWNWKPGGVAAERAMWNDTFERGVGFERAPNKLLVEVVRGVPPGAALDLMTGQGRNALFLATQGWKTTGIDISDVGLREARDSAQRLHVEVELVRAYVDTYELGVARWDLVTMIYAGSDRALIARAQAATRPGGLFVVEFFLRTDGPMGFASGELAAQFADWDILRDEVVDDVADWSKQPTQLVRFVARKRTR